MLRRKIQGGRKFLTGGKGSQKKHPKPKYISFFASRRPSPSLGQRQRKPSWPTLPLKNQRAPLCHWGLLPSPHFPTHTVPFPSLSLLSCRSPSWSKKGDAAPLSWNKPRKPKGKLFLSFSRPQTPSAPASRPRSQHLLHFWPPPCHWDFWLPKPEATQGSFVPCWSRRPSNGGFLSLLHPALPSPCTRENQSFPLPLVLGESKPERNHHTAPYLCQKSQPRPRPHPHQPPTAAAETCPLHRSLPFPSHGLQLHPTEASRYSSHLRPNTAAALVVLFPVFSQSHSNTPAPPSAPVSPRPTTINRPIAASLLQQLITETMRKWEGRLKNSRREQKTETQGCQSPNRGSGGRHRRCRNEGGRGKLLILPSTRPACRRRRV